MFDCCNKSEGKPVHTKIDDELQLLPKGTKLTPGQVIYEDKKPNHKHRSENPIDYPLQNKPKNYAVYRTKLIITKRNNLLTVMYYRKEKQQQRRLKTKSTALSGKKIKKSVKYGPPTTTDRLHPDKPGEGGM